jgi:lysophospholipid acyltransferase (LPLAT)-like uncharacterized protein
MSLTKRLLRSDSARAIFVWFTAHYIRLVHFTTRWRTVMPAATRDYLAGDRPFIGCFWHGRMVMMRAGLPLNRRPRMLVSEHRDGLLISRALARLGVETVVASRKRGNLAALREMQRLLAEGTSLGITPDGPRGPRMRAKAGAIKIAQLSGAAILPVSGAVSHRRILGTWDRFCLALPFGRGVITWGEPIRVPRDADAAETERLRGLLEECLNTLTAEADREFGLPLVEPDAPESSRNPDAALERDHHARA